MDDDHPTRDDLIRARQVFGDHEPRDIFYRAATDLVRLAREGQASVNVAEALLVLLQTWNREYYRFHPATVAHYDALAFLLETHATWLSTVKDRSIDSFEPADEGAIGPVFLAFENVLGPVGAAKALHLLAPHFLPLWDRTIAEKYGVALGNSGTNSRRYLLFLEIVKRQSERVGGEAAVGYNVVKSIDEYNYCHFSRGWM